MSAVAAIGVSAPAAQAQAPVLIGFADALAAPETAWSLVDAGLRVVAFARRGSRPPLRLSRSVGLVEIASPDRDVSGAVADLRRLLESELYRAVMPLDDAAVWLCDQAAAGTGVPVAGPVGVTAALALDKQLQVAAARRAGFSVPPTRLVAPADVSPGPTEFPLMLKPADAVARRGDRLVRSSGRVCANRDELAAAVDARDGRLLAQPLLTGVGEGLFGLAGSAGLMALSAHRRLRMLNPQGSGSSACVSIAVDPQLIGPAQRMLSECGWRGMFMLEFLRTADGTPWFVELNGRPWGSMALARRCGLEYPAWAVRQLSDDAFTVDCGSPITGEVCRHLGRDLVHLLMVLRGPRSAAPTRWPPRLQTIRQVLAADRSAHLYNLRPGERRLFVDDTFRTVADAILRRGR